MTNLQHLADYLQGDENLNELLIDNFNNQDEDSYEFNGLKYHFFKNYDVEEILNEEFEEECEEAVKYLRKYDSPASIGLLEVIANLSPDDNYKNVNNDYDTLKMYQFETKRGDVFIYSEDN